MAGNVWEWSQDSYRDSYVDVPGDGSAWTDSGLFHILRGGSYSGSASFLRSAERENNSPTYASADYGVRCVRPVAPAEGRCGGVDCPPLPGYFVTCNAQDHCEYYNKDTTGWKKWDVWIYMPPGEFQMGCPPDPLDPEKCSETGLKPSSDLPQHPVKIDYGFLIGKYEVVVSQYEACTAADSGGCSAPAFLSYGAPTGDWTGWGLNNSANGRTDHPQNGIIWQQARDFCGWVAPGGRLPSEAEWEYAATGPVHRKYPWGDIPEPACENGTAVFDQGSDGKLPWGCDDCTVAGCSGTKPVGSKPAGASWSGALDMAGNAFEWVEDTWHDGGYGGAPNDGSPWTGNHVSRIQRGAGFLGEVAHLRSSDRTQDPANSCSGLTGARCVRPLPCLPNCAGKECGVDGCEGSCGMCDAGMNCQQGTCVSDGFVHVKAGSFWMGSPSGCPGPAGYTGSCTSEPGRDSWDAGSEKLHQVKLTHDFEMEATEVTQGEWKAAFGGWNPSGFPGCGEGCPVESVSWYDTLAFANWKSEQAGLTPCYVFSGVKCADGSSVAASYKDCLNGTKKGIDSGTVGSAGAVGKPYECEGYRLPTESEWEYAARAETLTAYHDGQQSDSGHLVCEVPFHLTDIAWYCGNNSPSGTKAVGGKTANGWGLKDMSGNVWEWCWDKYCTDNTGYGDDPDASSCVGSLRVLRGGSWVGSAGGCRSAARFDYSPGTRGNNLGGRLARTL